MADVSILLPARCKLQVGRVNNGLNGLSSGLSWSEIRSIRLIRSIRCKAPVF